MAHLLNSFYAALLLVFLGSPLCGHAAVRDPRPAQSHHSKQKLEWIKVSHDGKGFVRVASGKPFTPWGFNYDRDYKMRLLEEYWNDEWQTIVEDFRKMKNLGANVVRVHLQFPKFMDAPDQPNQAAFKKLENILSLAEETGVYLDVTGLGGYRKADVPVWFDALTENERWTAQANFWRHVAKHCRRSPAVFCYNLMNEPVVPNPKFKDWLVGEFAGFYYVQAIALDLQGRNRTEVGRQWISQMTAAIRQHDKRHLITIGLLPNSADKPSGSGFQPREIVSEVDFISVHYYPRAGELEKDLNTVKKFSVGKPVVIEEIFPMHCSSKELRTFIERSRQHVNGWIGFYWGQTPEDLRNGTTLSDLLTREWLELFQQMQVDSPTQNSQRYNLNPK
ncbi:MAG: cellulase family glycosylhydrolase [Verrucomicrobia bacterium]|nr:cellulase family glycosylhydrolase [Verrucomicrobiota bacterium]